jgi:SM-20-related protein
LLFLTKSLPPAQRFLVGRVRALAAHRPGAESKEVFAPLFSKSGCFLHELGGLFQRAYSNRTMAMLDLEKFRSSPVASDPYPHVVVPAFVRAPALAEVVAALPPMRGRGSFPIGALRLGPAAKALVAGLEGAEFREITAQKFGLDLAGAPLMTTLRGNSGEQDGRIHADSTAKRVTILLYLNPGTGNAWADQSGCLRLLRSQSDLEDYAVEVPPVDGTLLVFPNGPNTWHGHKQFIGRRYVIQMNYMTTGAKARSEMRRHQFSAFVKRLRRAA